MKSLINHLHYIKDAPLLVSHRAIIILARTMKNILIFDAIVSASFLVNLICTPGLMAGVIKCNKALL